MKYLRHILILVCFMGVAVPSFAQDATELLLRLDKLESDNRRLTGQVEQQQFQVRRLEDQIKKFQADVDLRFKDVEGSKTIQKQPVQQVLPPAGVQKRSEHDASHDLTPRSLGAATGTLSDKPVKRDDDIMSPMNGRGTSSSSMSAPIVVQPQQSAATNSVKDMFDAGRGALDRAEYAQAETSFKDFIKAHPKDKLVPEATYGLGESYFARQKHTEAAEQYLNLTTKYGKSTRAPEGMLKLGMSLRALGSIQEACATLNEVLRRYPNANAGVKAAVTRESSRAKCAG
jgi:tol-pal system protein YbgF